MRLKGVSGLIIIVLALIGLAVYGGFQLIPSQTEATFSDVSCGFAEPEYVTIKCLRSGDPVTDTLSVINGQANNFPVRLADARITSYPDGYVIIVIDATTGQTLCSSKSSCLNMPLTFGRTYSFRWTCSLGFACPPSPNVGISGQGTKLKLSVTQIGIDEVDIPGTANCIGNDISSKIALTPENKYDIGWVADNTVPRSVSPELDTGYPIPRGIYRELAPLTAINYNGQAAYCDRLNKKIVGFTKITTWDNGCRLVLDSGNVLLDKTSARYFACTTSDCIAHGLSSDYAMVNYECVYQGIPEDQCNVLGDCGYTQFIDNADGTTVMKEPSSCTNNRCIFTTRQVACNPQRIYGNNQCCKRDVFGNYALEQCTTPIKSCETLGASACCLATQSQYTYKPAPEGKYCCDKENDGIGNVVESKAACGGDDDKCGFLGIDCFLKKIGEIAFLIFLGIVILLVLIIIAKVAR